MDSQIVASQTTRHSDSSYVKVENQEDGSEYISEDSPSYEERDEWLLKFEINEKGVGRILLPPSLSVFLQSDRICIMPLGGGLFVKSV